MSGSSTLSARVQTYGFMGAAFNTVNKIIREYLLGGDINTKTKWY